MYAAVVAALAGACLAAPATAEITYAYDPAGRLVRVNYAGGRSVSYTYDANGNLLRRASEAVLVAAHVYDGAGWWSRLTLVNSGDSDNPVTFQLYDDDGSLALTKTADGLPPGAQFSADVGSYFGTPVKDRSLSVRVISRSPLKGVLEFGQGDLSLVTLPLLSSASTRLTFPYVVVYPDPIYPFYTGLTLVNASSSTASVVLTGYTGEGEVLGSTDPPAAIPANGKLTRLVNEVFPDDATRVRAIAVASSQPLVGFELFGKLGEYGVAGLAASASGSPMFRAAGSEADDLHYRLCFPEIPDPASYYTGVTFSNTSALPVTARVSLHGADGAPLSAKDWPLGPMQQLTSEIWTAAGGVRPPGAAYMVVRSTGPLVGFELNLSGMGAGDAFQFDGTPASPSSGAKVQYFPLLGRSPEYQASLRLVNLSGAGNAYVLRVFDSSGIQLGTSAGTVVDGGKADLKIADLFPSSADRIAWCKVEAQAEILADAFIVSTSGTRLGGYTGVR